MICRKCGREFPGERKDWPYTRVYDENMRRGHIFKFCSWTCMEAYRREELDKKRKTVRTAGKSQGGRSLRNALKIEPGEAHTLEEWAELYSIDYYQMVESLLECNRLTLEDILWLHAGKEERSHVCL